MSEPYTSEQLKTDSLSLATLTNGYAGNLDVLHKMQTLAKQILKGLRELEHNG